MQWDYGDIEEEGQLFENTVVVSAGKVCCMWGEKRKCLCEEVSMVTPGKRCAYEVWLQRKDEVSYILVIM